MDMQRHPHICQWCHRDLLDKWSLISHLRDVGDESAVSACLAAEPCIVLTERRNRTSSTTSTTIETQA